MVYSLVAFLFSLVVNKEAGSSHCPRANYAGKRALAVWVKRSHMELGSMNNRVGRYGFLPMLIL